MIPLTIEAADICLVAISAHLANAQPAIPLGSLVILRNAHAAALDSLPVDPPDLPAYLASVVPVGPALDNPPGYHPRLGDWLTLFNEDGSPDPVWMNPFLQFVQLGLLIPQAVAPPAVQEQVPFALPAAQAVAPLAAQELVPVDPHPPALAPQVAALLVAHLPRAPARPLTFSSADHFRTAMSRLPMCHVLNGGTMCSRTPVHPHNLCATHIGSLSLLTGYQASGPKKFASAAIFYDINIPLLADLVAARGIPTGEFNPLHSALEFIATYTPPLHVKPRLSPHASALGDPAKLPGSEVLNPLTTLAVFNSASRGMSVEDCVSTSHLPDHVDSHFTHSLWALWKYFGPEVFTVAFSPPGTIRNLLAARGNVVTDLRPLTPLLAKYGIGASPAFADLFGVETPPFWAQHSALFPNLATKLFAGGCSVREFLDLFTHYHDLLVITTTTSGRRVLSICEEIFSHWANDNSFSQEFIDTCVNQGLHLQFNVNQWLVAVFTSIHEQTTRLLGDKIGQTDPRMTLIQLTIIQAVRSVHSFPGLVLPIDIEPLQHQDGSKLANWKPRSTGEPFPFVSIDRSLTTADLLLRARVQHSTSHLNRGAYSQIPSPPDTTTFKDSAKKGESIISMALLPSARAPPTERSPVRPDSSIPRGSSTYPPPVAASPTVRKRPFEEAQSPSHKAASAPRNTSPQLGSEALTNLSQENQAWLDFNLGFLLEHVPSQLKTAYETGLKARLRSGMPVKDPQFKPDLRAGWKAIPLYRLTPRHPHYDAYCCACGTPSRNGGHPVHQCPLMSVPGTPLDTGIPVSFPQALEHPIPLAEVANFIEPDTVMHPSASATSDLDPPRSVEILLSDASLPSPTSPALNPFILPRRPPGAIHTDLSIFTRPNQTACLSLALERLRTELAKVPPEHPFQASVVSFLDRASALLPNRRSNAPSWRQIAHHPLLLDHMVIATAAAEVWLDHLSVSAGSLVQTASTDTPPATPSSETPLDLSRQAAISRSLSTTLPQSTSLDPFQVSNIVDIGRSRNKETASFSSQQPVVIKPSAASAEQMIIGSPYTAHVYRQGMRPYPRVDHTAERQFNKQVTDLRLAYDSFRDSGLPRPKNPAPTTIDTNIPQLWLDCLIKDRTAKGKSLILEPHQCINVLALLQLHTEASIYPCLPCEAGTCHRFEIAAMAQGPPTPFVANCRPPLKLQKAVYPLSEEAQGQAFSEILEYLAKGVLRQVPLETPCLEHPVFVVAKYRFAPDPTTLKRLYSQVDGPLSTYIQLRSARTVDNALLRQGTFHPTADPSHMSASALNDSLNSERSPTAKLRLVFDYGLELNILLADWAFRYVGLDTMLTHIRYGMWVASFDISAAFVLIPIAPCDQPQFAIRWPASGRMRTDGSLFPGDTWLKFFQTRHLFGSKHLPALFSTVSAEIVNILSRRARKYCGDGSVSFEIRRRPTFDAYMDDLFIGATSKPLCELACEDAKVVLRYLNILWNDKTRPPAQASIPMLGVEVDTLAMTVSLPLAKAYSTGFMCGVAFELVTKGIFPPENFWNKLLGRLEHAKTATRGGSGRLALIRHAMLVSRPDSSSGSTRTPLASAPHLLESLDWWLHALTDAPPTARLFTSCAASSPAAERLRTRSDASGNVGAALHCADNFVMHMRWTEQIATNPSIQLKELYPIVLFMERYGYLLSGLSLPFGTDNLPNVFGVNKRSMRDPAALDWLVYLVDLADFHHVLLLPTWIPREANTEADVASKSYNASDIAKLYVGFEQCAL